MENLQAENEFVVDPISTNSLDDFESQFDMSDDNITEDLSNKQDEVIEIVDFQEKSESLSKAVEPEEMTPAAALAQYKKEQGFFPAELEVPSNMTMEDFEEQFSKQLEENFNQEKKYDDQVYQLAEFLLAGGTVPEAQDLASQQDFADVDISSEEEQRRVYTAYLQAKGNDADEIEELVESASLTEGRLKAKANTAQEYFKTQKDEAIKIRAAEEKAKKRERQEAVAKKSESIKNLISEGKVAGFTIPKSDRHKLNSYFFDKNVPVEVYDDNGDKQIIQTTGYNKAWNDFLKDPEQLIKHGYELMEGPNASKLTAKIKKDVNNSIFSKFNTSKTTLTSDFAAKVAAGLKNRQQ